MFSFPPSWNGGALKGSLSLLIFNKLHKQRLSISDISVFREHVVSPLSSCLIKISQNARAVIYVIAEDNSLISLQCLQPGTTLYLTISPMDKFICVKTGMAPHSNERRLYVRKKMPQVEEIRIKPINVSGPTWLKHERKLVEEKTSTVERKEKMTT